MQQRYSSTLSLTSRLVVGGGWTTPSPIWKGVKNLAPPTGIRPQTFQPAAGRYTGRDKQPIRKANGVKHSISIAIFQTLSKGKLVTLLSIRGSTGVEVRLHLFLISVLGGVNNFLQIRVKSPGTN